MPSDDEDVERQAPLDMPTRPTAKGSFRGSPSPSAEKVGLSSIGDAWHRGESGRWIVGDPGQQELVQPLPSDRIALSRPDSIIDGGRLGEITYRAASLRGLSHQESGKPRQDAYIVRPSRDGLWLIGCVADGVSAARHSHEAADIACEVLTSRIVLEAPTKPPTNEDAWLVTATRLPWQAAADAVSERLVERATNIVRQAYEKIQRPPDVFDIDGLISQSNARSILATTAIGFIVSTQQTHHGYPYAVSMISGDSSAAVLSNNEWIVTAVSNMNSEIFSSEVDPLPRALAVGVSTGYLRGGEALAVYSDGIGDPLGSGRGTVGSFLADMWKKPPGILEFAQQVGFLRKSFTDDRTAVVIWFDREST